MELIRHFPLEVASNQFFGALVENLVCYAQVFWDKKGPDHLAEDLLDLAIRLRLTKSHYWSGDQFENFLSQELMYSNRLPSYEHPQFEHLSRMHMLMRFAETFLLSALNGVSSRIGYWNKDKQWELVVHRKRLSDIGKAYVKIEMCLQEWVNGV